MSALNYQHRGTKLEVFQIDLVQKIQEQLRMGMKTITLCNWKVGGNPLERSEIEWSQFGTQNEEVSKLCQKLQDFFHVKVLPSTLGCSFCIYLYFNTTVEVQSTCCVLL